MKKNPAQMSTQEIERELNNFEWEYIVLSDKVQTDEQYAAGAFTLDERKHSLTEELNKRMQS